MNYPKFKYYLRIYNSGLAAYEYYYLDANADVQKSITKRELVFTPNGWREKSIQLIRGFTYWGVLRSFSLPLKFVRDGAKVLRYLSVNFGIEAACKLYIEKFNSSKLVYTYEAYYEGDLNFSRLNDIKDFAEIDILESGFLSKFKSKEDTTFEIPIMTNPNVIWVKMEGHKMKCVTKWTGIPNERPVGTGTASAATFTNYGTDGVSLNLAFFDQFLIPGATYKLIQNYSDVAQEVTLSYDFYYNLFIPTATSSGGYFTLLYEIVRDSDGVVISKEVAYQSAVFLPNGSSATYVGSASNTFIIPAKHTVITTIRVYIFAVTSGPQLMPSSYEVKQLGSDINLLLYNIYPTTYIPALLPTDVGVALVDKIDTTATFNFSTSTPGKLQVLTSGDGLRQLDNAVIKTSFSEFFKAMKIEYAIYMRYLLTTNNVYFDDFASIFDLGNIIEIGEASTLKITPFISEAFSKLIIGYPNFTTNSINGKDEFNLQLEFQSQITKVTNTLDLVSPYNAGMYQIELTRINYEGKLSADSDSDNEVFWLEIEGTAGGAIPSGPGAGQTYYNLYRDLGLVITGLDNPDTAFNIGFSPKRKLLLQGNYVKSLLYPLSADLLNYTTSSKQTNAGTGMETDDAGNIVTEKQSIAINDLDGGLLFYPFIFEIEAKNITNYNSLLTNQKGQIHFTYKGVDLYGWILEIGDNPSENQTQTFKLLCSTDTNLNYLIH